MDKYVNAFVNYDKKEKSSVSVYLAVQEIKEPVDKSFRGFQSTGINC